MSIRDLEDLIPEVSDKKVLDFLLRNSVAMTTLLQHIIIEGVVEEALIEGKYGVKVVHDQHGYVYSVRIDPLTPFGEINMVRVDTPDVEIYDKETLRAFVREGLQNYYRENKGDHGSLSST